MVSRFRRNLSFPNRPSSPKKPYHTRSTSLPCRSHPLISQLQDEINNLKIWESKPEIRTSAWLCEGLIMLKNVHDSFEDLLHLSQTQDSLRRSDWVEKLLEDYLRFVDVYGIFRASIVSLKEEQLAAQVAIRRKDDSKISSYVKSRKKIDKEMMKLGSAVRFTGDYSVSEGDAELAGVLRDVNEVTVSVTICLIRGISGASSSINSKSNKSSLMRWKLWKKTNEKEEGIREVVEVMESLCEMKKLGGNDDEEERIRVLDRMEGLDECIGEIESGSERVFRSLINTRVSLLNILTQ
ncbi:Protein of unknown function DUF241 [Macleaya cordata]|uniref:Uncharacterized protein n=1 Tax=Macleaya cordata TaxID=56857 RepID=A0A200QKF1_MACCD|nr:Protein of unknown function DUF241 [Macleaya cordata]